MTQKRHSVYLDYAAATPLDDSARTVITAYLENTFANPNALHAEGKEAGAALAQARADIAREIGCSADELFFTAGGSDANTRALYGVVHALQDSGKNLSDMHIIVSAIEHQSVRGAAELLSRRGVRVSYAPVTFSGIIDIQEIERLIEPKTVLVSVMLVNNEIGVLEPLRDLVRVVRRRGTELGTDRLPLVHSDMSQAFSTVPIQVKELDVDLATFDAGKIYGPVGIGALYVRNGTPYAGLVGALHKPDRGGTPSVALALGFAEAVRRSAALRAAHGKRMDELRAYMRDRILERFPEAHCNGDSAPTSGGILNVSFPGHEGEFLVTQLSARGVAVSSKSACLSGGGEGSFVVAALNPEYAGSTLRFSFGRETTEDDIDYAVSVLSDIL